MRSSPRRGAPLSLTLPRETYYCPKFSKKYGFERRATPVGFSCPKLDKPGQSRGQSKRKTKKTRRRRNRSRITRCGQDDDSNGPEAKKRQLRASPFLGLVPRLFSGSVQRRGGALPATALMPCSSPSGAHCSRWVWRCSSSSWVGDLQSLGLLASQTVRDGI